MTLSELRDYVRRKTRDTVKPYFVSDDEIDDNLNEAQNEACERALLIEDHDSFTIELNTTDTRYELDPLIIDVLSISAGTDPSREFTGWTLTETHLVLDRKPATAEVLTLHCYRLPSSKMVGDNDQPEIRSHYHERMADWAIHLGYLIPDSELMDAQAADRYAARFTQAFGERHSALTRRNQRSKPVKAVAYNGYL